MAVALTGERLPSRVLVKGRGATSPCMCKNGIVYGDCEFRPTYMPIHRLMMPEVATFISNEAEMNWWLS